jgi:magnesium chelatase family protein
LSARSYHRVLKVARTVADLEAAVDVEEHHVLEVLQFRMLDRRGR